jgi:hypothetical protein
MLTQVWRRTRLGWAGVLALPTLVAADSEPQRRVPGSAPSADFTIIAGDYYLQLPRTIPSGWRTVRFHNEGRDFHHAVFLKVASPQAAQTALTALDGWREDVDQPVPGAVSMGGVEGSFVPAPGGDHPGEDTYAVVDLHPGWYLVICMIPTDHRLHVNRGMHALLRVVTARNPPTAPAPDATLRTAEYAYTLTPRSLAPGWRLVEVLNTGTAQHVAEVVRLKTGHGVADIFAAQGSSSADPVESTSGGSTRLGPGTRAFMWLHLTPGTYIVQCPLQTGDHQSHLRKGMLRDLVVPPP